MSAAEKGAGPTLTQMPERSDGKRVETGPIRFGGDHPGIFIRGDAALAYANYIKGALSGDQLGRRYIERLATILAECHGRNFTAEQFGEPLPQPSPPRDCGYRGNTGHTCTHPKGHDSSLPHTDYDMPCDAAEPSPPSAAPPTLTRFEDFDDVGHPFNKWWTEHGQYMLSGGGRRQMIWAARGWIAREQLAEGVEVTGESMHERVAPQPAPKADPLTFRDGEDSFTVEMGQTNEIRITIYEHSSGDQAVAWFLNAEQAEQVANVLRAHAARVRPAQAKPASL